MKVPFFVPSIGVDERAAVDEVLQSGWLTTGAKCRAFEEAFAGAVGAPQAHALNSCTAALHLALEALGVGRGDAVLVPSLTFAASAEVIRYLDAVPVFVDSDPSDCNIDLADARRVCEHLVAAGTPAKAIIVVHYGGQMVDVPAVEALAAEFHLAVIEDAAHAFPSSMTARGAQILPGMRSDAACFSFYANKTITTGEGGMVVCRDAGLMKRMRTMALHGIDRDAYARYSSTGSHYYEIVAAGYKYNLTDIAAALGLVQLRRAGELRDARAAIAERYTASLRGRPGVTTLAQHADRSNSWHLFAIRVDASERDALLERLRANGITPSVHWQPLHQMPYYRRLGLPQLSALENAERLGRELISLPIYPGMPSTAVDYVCEVLTAAVAQA